MGRGGRLRGRGSRRRSGLLSGCGMRNGEAAAVNVNNMVADDVYRIT